MGRGYAVGRTRPDAFSPTNLQMLSASKATAPIPTTRITNATGS